MTTVQIQQNVFKIFAVEIVNKRNAFFKVQKHILCVVSNEVLNVGNYVCSTRNPILMSFIVAVKNVNHNLLSIKQKVTIVTRESDSGKAVQVYFV